jgi:hypothetical protein
MQDASVKPWAVPGVAYLTRDVYGREKPILLVVHEEDGDWQFLDGEPYDEDAEGVAVHVVHLFEERPDLRMLSDMPRGWAAERASEDGEWERYPWVPDWGPAD